MPDSAPLSSEEAALLLALLPPPPSAARRPFGVTPERAALAWLRRAAEALVAALLAVMLLFHIAMLVPVAAPVPESSTSTAEAPTLSPAAAWDIAWADFVSPPVAVQGLGWVDLPVPVVVAVLRGLHSTFADPADVRTIMAAAHAAGLDALLLFACIGAEQPWDLRAAYPTLWRDYADNPFDIAVYGAWHPTPYTLAESAAIAARTLATRLSVPPPGNEPALMWIEDPHNPAGAGVYATDPHWWSNVAAIAEMLVQRTVAVGRGVLSAPALQSLSAFALAVGTTPAAVARALALKAQGTGPLAWVARQVSDLRGYVYQHVYAFAAGALAAGAGALGIAAGPGVLEGLAAAVAAAVADVAAAGVAVGAAAA